MVAQPVEVVAAEMGDEVGGVVEVDGVAALATLLPLATTETS